MLDLLVGTTQVNYLEGLQITNSSVSFGQVAALRMEKAVSSEEGEGSRINCPTEKIKLTNIIMLL